MKIDRFPHYFSKFYPSLVKQSVISAAVLVIAYPAVLAAATFWTFVREFSPLSPVIAQNSGSDLLGLRLVGSAGVAATATDVMIE